MITAKEAMAQLDSMKDKKYLEEVIQKFMVVIQTKISEYISLVDIDDIDRIHYFNESLYFTRREIDYDSDDYVYIEKYISHDFIENEIIKRLKDLGYEYVSCKYYSGLLATRGINPISFRPREYYNVRFAIDNRKEK